MAKKKGPTRIEVAARIYGCEVGDLMGQHVFEDGSVAIIAPTGQKFTYSAERIIEEQVKDSAAALRDLEEASAQRSAENSMVPEIPFEDGGHHAVEEPKLARKNRNK